MVNKLNYNPILLALDTSDLREAITLTTTLDGLVGGIKIGLQAWCSFGPTRTKELVGDRDWFLDLKFHDIPTTVFKAVTSVLPLEPAFISVHEAGGTDMLEATVAAAEGAASHGYKKPKILAVTTLTSVSRPLDSIVAQAKHALLCKVDGLISSALEVAALRQKFGTSFVSVVPGIRPANASPNDQIRTATPKAALEAGANFIVIGRPITEAADPASVCGQILSSLG
jgi:orotidine-5'-phosphate decarboxylase